MSNTATLVMSRRRIAEIVGPEAAVLVGRIERAEMEFGVHHRWTDEQVFTAAGVQVLVERLAETHAGPSLALRAEAKKHFTAPYPPVALAPVTARVRIEGELENRSLVAPLGGPVRDRANGYMPDTDGTQ